MDNARWQQVSTTPGIYWNDEKSCSSVAHAFNVGDATFAWCLLTPDNHWRVEYRLSQDDRYTVSDWTYHDTFDTLQQAKDVAQALVLLGGAG